MDEHEFEIEVSTERVRGVSVAISIARGAGSAIMTRERIAAMVAAVLTEARAVTEVRATRHGITAFVDLRGDDWTSETVKGLAVRLRHVAIQAAQRVRDVPVVPNPEAHPPPTASGMERAIAEKGE